MQALEELKKRMAGTEKELSGFTDNIEKIRAAGRMEAMRDLMQTVAESLVRAGTLCSWYPLQRWQP